MKTVLILASLVALSLAGTVPTTYNVQTKPVDADFVARQKKVFSLFHNAGQVNPEAEYYKIGKEWDVEAHKECYTNKEAVEEFLALYRTGFMPKYKPFSIFYDRMRDEAIALYELFIYAKDFETFYKTAAYARVHFNEGQFYYALYVAAFQRTDTKGIVLPAPYELFPELFTNADSLFKAYRIKMQDGITLPEAAKYHGIVKENDYYVTYTNYSSYWTYGNEEARVSYFTEDIGLNAYNFYYNAYIPFWMKGEQFGILKERRGEAFFFFYQQLLARFYMERLTNGLGEIPDFSWSQPIKTGFTPFMSSSAYPFVQRNNHYYLQTEENSEDIQFLDTYEKTFLQFLQRGHFKAYAQEVDLRNSKAVNFVGNYWQANADLYDKFGSRNYERSYEAIARRLLSAAPAPVDKYSIAPAALDFYATSLRDPIFWQLKSKVIKYFLMAKEYLEPYTQDNLHYVGVKINDVKVDKLVTFFDFFDYDVSNAMYSSKDELKSQSPVFKMRQPRLNNKPFNVEIDVKSDVEGDAVFKVFLGPKYDSKGYPITLEDNWMNFFELDTFVRKLTPGQNKIERSSEDFFYFKEDSIPTSEVFKMLDQGKVPQDMSQEFESMPKRLMLPKGTEGGYPFQLFVFVYPFQAPGKEFESFKFLIDNKPFGYPLDRPVSESYFKQPNMFFEDVFIYFEGEHFPYSMNNPFHVSHKNEVPKH